MDGFRELAYVGCDQTRPISRRGNVYKSFPDLCAGIHVDLACKAALGREIVCLDAESLSQFYQLLRRRGHAEPVAFLKVIEGQFCYLVPPKAACQKNCQQRSVTLTSKALWIRRLPERFLALASANCPASHAVS